MRRVPEVIDVWFDSGAMPFAQHHAPFENQELFEARFPADYICEAIDQTRGWFYSLIAISTLLFDRSPYKTVLCLGHIADAEGKKMSKSLGNIVPPWEVLERHGADAFRWYFLTSKQPWDGYLFSVDAVGESLRQFLLQLWNTYGFYVHVRERQRRRARRRRRARERPRPLGALAARRHGRDRDASGSTPTTPRAPATRSRRSSTTSPTGTCGARAGASGTATRPPSRRCAPAWSRSRSCSRRSARSWPTRSTTTSTAPSRACT